MNHIEYENSMIECVNRNCDNAEQARVNAFAAEEKRKREAYLAAEEAEKAKRICMKRHAAVKIVIWLEVFVCALLFALHLNLRGIAPAVVQAAICGVVGLVVGARVNAMARAFRK